MEIQNLGYLIALLVLLIVSLATISKLTRDLLFELKYMLPAVIFTTAILVMINTRLAELQILVFNPVFLTGTNILSYPLEEWLFLPVVSLLSFAAYIFAKKRLTNFEKPNLFVVVSLVILLISGLITWFSRQKLYPFSIFMLLTIYFGYTIFRNRFKHHLTSFYLGFAIALVPFFILKATLFKLPVIIPDTNFMLGLSLVNMPIEEFAYFFLLILINATIYEYLRERRLF
jgi:hypothetical protein